jgi:hypothetical protein
MNLGLSLSLGGMRAGGGWPPSITSSDGDPASLIDNGDNTVDVVIDGVTVGTITRAQVTAGGWITVVAPVAGMSGDDVVQTTQGYVIYVGNVSIETDVEVLADGAVVGTALPFDATAYPDAKLDVRWSFTVGFGADLVITDEARAAPLKIIQFRDSYLAFDSQGSNPNPPYAVASRTRQMTKVLRFSGNFNNSATISANIGVIFQNGFRIANNRFNTSPNFFQTRSVSPNPSTSLGTVQHYSAGANETCSLMVAIDYDGGLPGGETLCVWASRNGGAWAKLYGEVAPPLDGRFVWTRLIGSDSANGNTGGGSFDIHNHLWIANQALDPATNYTTFFEANGAVKVLPIDGVVGGVTPVIFMTGDDFVTGNNRGSGPNVQYFGIGRTPVTVINA